KTKKEKKKFPGAIVYDTLPGRNNWLFTIDLTALYPSTMIMLGLSIETMLFQCINGQKDYIDVMTRKKDTVISLRDVSSDEEFNVMAEDLYDVIREECYVISANGTIFNGNLGLLSEFVKEIFLNRKENRNLAAKYEKEGNSDM